MVVVELFQWWSSGVMQPTFRLLTSRPRLLRFGMEYDDVDSPLFMLWWNWIG
jgi:hypothetical protein